MDNALWWFGAAHAAAYAVVGCIYITTWLMHRTLRYLGLWKYVIEGFSEKKRAERQRANHKDTPHG